MIILLIAAIAFAHWFSPKLGGLIMYFSDGTYSHRYIEDIAQPFLDKDFSAIIFILFPFVIIGTAVWLERPDLERNVFLKAILKFYFGLGAVCLAIVLVQFLTLYNPFSDWTHAGLDVVKKSYVLVDKKKKEGDYYVTLKDLKTAQTETHNLGYKCRKFDENSIVGKHYEFDQYIHTEENSKGEVRPSEVYLIYFEWAFCGHH